MNCSVRLIHCEACSELLFCSSGSSHQCLRSACHGRLTWGHRNPFTWTISPCSKGCPLMMLSGQRHALCSVSRISFFPSVHFMCFPTTSRTSHVPPESSLHQLAPSDLYWTLIDCHLLPSFLKGSFSPPTQPPNANQLLQMSRGH